MLGKPCCFYLVDFFIIFNIYCKHAKSCMKHCQEHAKPTEGDPIPNRKAILSEAIAVLPRQTQQHHRPKTPPLHNNITTKGTENLTEAVFIKVQF